MSADVSMSPVQAKKKKKKVFFRDKDKAVCKGCCGENGVLLAGGPLWFTNAASVAAAVALL